MTPRAFFDLVAEMREAQKKYFRLRSSSSLQESKYLEGKVDAEISRVQKLIIDNTPKEKTLFEDHEN